MPKKLKFSYLNHISMTEKVAKTAEKNEKQNFKLKKNSNRPEYRNLPNFERFLSFARYRREGGSMT